MEVLPLAKLRDPDDGTPVLDAATFQQMQQLWRLAQASPLPTLAAFYMYVLPACLLALSCLSANSFSVTVPNCASFAQRLPLVRRWRSRTCLQF